VPISFSEIPLTLRTPGVHVEFDPSRAVQGLDIVPYRVLLQGVFAAGTATAAVPYLLTNQAQVELLFGPGGQLTRMYRKFRENNRFTEVWGIGWTGAGTEAVRSFTLTGPATAAGSVFLYIDGERIAVNVADAESETEIAAAVIAAVNADTTLPVTAANTAGLVDLTVKWGGVDGDEMPVRINYHQGEQLPAGVGVGAVSTSQAGAGTYAFSVLLAGMGETQYHLIGYPHRDATEIAAIEAELADRWGPIRQNDGTMLMATPQDVTDSVTLGGTRNSEQTVIVNGYNVEAHAASLVGAVLGQVAEKGNQDPARPFQTLPLAGILPPRREDRPTLSELDTLLHNGIATLQADEGGVMRIQRLITTYQTDGASNPDTAYLNLNSKLTLSLLRAQFLSRFSSKYPRHKLAGDDAAIGSGQAVLKPSIAKAEAIAIFRDWEEAGYVENVSQFKDDLIVERNATNVDRLDILLPPDLVNQLRQVGVLFQFRL
jgi:phage tail sheath gpL-like